MSVIADKGKVEHEPGHGASLRRAEAGTARDERQAGAVALGPAGVLALQRSAGNAATTAWISAQRARSQQAEAHGALHVPATPVQRLVLPQTSDALMAAAQRSNEFATTLAQVEYYVPEDDQKKINDIEPTSTKVKRFFSNLGRREEDADGRAGLLTKLIRAVIHAEYAERMSNLGKRPDKEDKKDKKDWEKIHKFYLSKTLLNRDKHKALLIKGIGATETQSFLKGWGLADALTAQTEEEKSSEIKDAPRIDVRSTFTGGPILGINVRAHLFAVYTLADGRQMYVRGGPGGKEVGSPTRVDIGLYAPGTVDWDPSAPSKTVLKGEAANNRLDSIVEAAAAVNAMNVPYVSSMFKVSKRGLMSGENCNASLWTVLDRAGIPTAKPSGIHPGWGHTLGAHSGEGKALAGPEEEAEPTEELKIDLPNDTPVYGDRALVEERAALKAGTSVHKVIEISTGGTTVYKIRWLGGSGFIHEDDLDPDRDKPTKNDRASRGDVGGGDLRTTKPMTFHDQLGEMEIPVGTAITDEELPAMGKLWIDLNSRENEQGFVEAFYGMFGQVANADLKANGYDKVKPYGAPKQGGDVADNPKQPNVGEVAARIKATHLVVGDSTPVELADRTTIFVPAGTSVEVNSDYIRPNMDPYTTVMLSMVWQGKLVSGKVEWGRLKGIEGGAGEGKQESEPVEEPRKEQSQGAGGGEDAKDRRYAINPTSGDTVEVTDMFGNSQGKNGVELPKGALVELIGDEPHQSWERVEISYKLNNKVATGWVYFMELGNP